MKKWTNICFLLLMSGAIFLSCRKKDAPLPDNLASFESTAYGISETSNDLDIKLRLTRATDQNISVVIQLTPEGVAYSTHFTTTPEASSNVLNLTIPAGSSEVSFKVNKVADAKFDGDETIKFRLESVASPVLPGANTELTVSFAEIISEEEELDADGGGATFGNKVFIDLSTNRLTAVQRTKWDLGFWSGDDFRVILNSSTGMMARVLDKTNLNDVSAADTAGFAAEVSFNAFSTDALAYIDYPDGDLQKTAIAAISATAEENKVYIINRGTGIGNPAPHRGWKKIRVIRSSSGYILQHADIGATTFTETEVSKDDGYFFNYVSFEDGAVDIEPQKTKWDIAWTYFSNVTSFGGGEIPYGFQDFVIQNRNVGSVGILNSVISYENFAEANLEGLDFAQKQNNIGPDWRSGGGPGVAPAVRTDRFYVIRDGDGNYYKLKFLSLTRDGERGFVNFEYKLVKKGQ